MAHVAAGLRKIAGHCAFQPFPSEAEYLGGYSAKAVVLIFIDTQFLRCLDAFETGNRFLKAGEFVELADPDKYRALDLGNEVAQRHLPSDLPVEIVLVRVTRHVHVVILGTGLSALEDRREVACDAFEAGEGLDAAIRYNGAVSPIAAHADTKHSDLVAIDGRFHQRSRGRAPSGTQQPYCPIDEQ